MPVLQLNLTSESMSVRYFHCTRTTFFHANYTTLVALTGILPRRQRLREDARRKQRLHVPLRGALRLPRPKHPSGSRLIGIELRLDEAADILLLLRAQRVDCA